MAVSPVLARPPSHETADSTLEHGPGLTLSPATSQADDDTAEGEKAPDCEGEELGNRRQEECSLLRTEYPVPCSLPCVIDAVCLAQNTVELARRRFTVPGVGNTGAVQLGVADTAEAAEYHGDRQGCERRYEIYQRTLSGALSLAGC